jgi:hypothetical protein
MEKCNRLTKKLIVKKVSLLMIGLLKVQFLQIHKFK